jgi:adenosylcobinamide-GDP ribazoletransferase
MAAAVAVAADLALTGYLHVDGLVDAADGLLPPMTTERRLAAMADPGVGAFGAVSLGAVLLLRFGAFATIRPMPLVLGGLWCASRTSMAIIATTVPYARTQGLVSTFIGARPGGLPQRLQLPGALAVGAGGSVALVVVGDGLHGLLALGLQLIAVGAVTLLSWRRIGGFTGDVLGAAGVIGETVGLLVLAAR